MTNISLPLKEEEDEAKAITRFLTFPPLKTLLAGKSKSGGKRVRSAKKTLTCPLGRTVSRPVLTCKHVRHSRGHAEDQEIRLQ